jgi:SAM-dependent methyltransferase
MASGRRARGRTVTRAPLEATVERAWREVAAIDGAFERGEIDQAGWHERMAALIVPAYLAGADPRAQSGYGGSEADWRQARGLVADAVSRSGSFLDVGCASGLLMESVRAWCAERGLAIEPYGVDVSPELAALARARLPEWADRVFAGNAAAWVPPRRFDFVRTGLEYVPRARRPALVAHLAANTVAPGGRLLIGPYTEERDGTRAGPSREDEVRAAGFAASGRFERVHPRDDRVVRRLFWLDVP